MSDQELDDLFKEASEKVEVPFDDASWDKMAKMLDDPASVRPVFWNWKTIGGLLSLLLIGGALVGVSITREEKTELPASSPATQNGGVSAQQEQPRGSISEEGRLADVDDSSGSISQRSDGKNLKDLAVSDSISMGYVNRDQGMEMQGEEPSSAAEREVKVTRSSNTDDVTANRVIRKNTEMTEANANASPLVNDAKDRRNANNKNMRQLSSKDKVRDQQVVINPTQQSSDSRKRYSNGGMNVTSSVDKPEDSANMDNSSAGVSVSEREQAQEHVLLIKEATDQTGVANDIVQKGLSISVKDTVVPEREKDVHAFSGRETIQKRSAVNDQAVVSNETLVNTTGVREGGQLNSGYNVSDSEVNKQEDERGNVFSPSLMKDSLSADGLSDSLKREEVPFKSDTSITDKVYNDDEINKSDSIREQRFSVKALLSPDYSSVGYYSPGKAGLNYGLLVEYALNKHFYISAGAIWSRKVYTDTEVKGNGYGSVISSTSLDGRCRVLDLPLNINYYFTPEHSFTFYGTVGLSSYLMFDEYYVYDYVSGLQHYSYTSNIPRGDNEWFKMMNLSLGIQQRLSRQFSLQLEPFIKVPLTGIGGGDLKLVSSGAFINLKYTF